MTSITLRYRILPGVLSSAQTIAFLDQAMTLAATIGSPPQANPNRSILELLKLTPDPRLPVTAAYVAPDLDYPAGHYLITVLLEGGADYEALAPTPAARLPLLVNLFTLRLQAATGSLVTADTPEVVTT